MTPKEKAEELVKKYEDYVCGYVGSSMLTNTEYPEQILRQAKQCALIAVDEIIDAIDWHEYEVPNNQLKFWFEVKQEIEKL